MPHETPLAEDEQRGLGAPDGGGAQPWVHGHASLALWLCWGWRLFLTASVVRLLWFSPPGSGWLLALLLGAGIATGACVGGYRLARWRLHVEAYPRPDFGPSSSCGYVVQECCLLTAGTHLVLQPLGSDLRMPLTHGDRLLVALPQASVRPDAGTP